MPRQPDPDLEERILKAAQTLWKRGGDKALTMRTVARAAGTNTPAVYRRFKDRHALVHGLLLRTTKRIRKSFESGKTIEDMADVYIDLAIDDPHEYRLFYGYSRELSPKKSSRLLPIRETRPNFALLEQRIAARIGGPPEEHTQLAIALWATVHGTTMLLLDQTVPGHEDEVRAACRAAVQALLKCAEAFHARKHEAGV
jgi:AcrR family transcriptional regulator